MTITENAVTDQPTLIPEWTVGDRLKKARTQAGLKQEDIAKHFDMSITAVSSWEADGGASRKISLVQVIEGYAKLTGVDPAWIAGFRTGSR